jgi:hypothetical protein
VERRWDIDERGRGVGDGRRLAPGARELVDALELPEWVAEEPDVHLLPHLERACATEGSPLELEGAEALPDGTYEVRLRWHGGEGSVSTARAAVFCLIGVVAEGATYVRQRGGEGELLFEVGTGMLEGDTDFAPHGHTLLLRLTHASAS